MEAAAEVFAEQGFEGATLAAIAERAGFTRAAIYPYFASKRELLVAAINEYIDRFLSRHDAWTADHAVPRDPAESLGMWVDAHASERDTLNLLLLELRLRGIRNAEDREEAAAVERRLDEEIVKRITKRYEAVGAVPPVPAAELAPLTEIVSVGVRVRASLLGVDPRPLFLAYLELIDAARRSITESHRSATSL